KPGSRTPSGGEQRHRGARLFVLAVGRSVAIPLLQVGSRPHVVVARPVIEMEHRMLAAVLDDARYRLSIGMTEVIAVRRHAIGLAVEELQELGAQIVL